MIDKVFFVLQYKERGVKMKQNNKLKTLKVTSLWLFMAFAVLTACSSECNQEPVQKDEAKIAILPHTPESFKKYEDNVDAYHKAQEKLEQADSINQVKQVQDSKLKNKDNGR